MYAILGGLTGSEFVKVMHCTSTNEIWDVHHPYPGKVHEQPDVIGI